MQNKSSSSNFTLALSFPGDQTKEEEVSSFSRRADAVFGGLETNETKPKITDSLSKVDPNLVDSQVPKKAKACFSCGNTSHLSRACPHSTRGSGSANQPTSQVVPSHLRDSSKYTHYTIDQDYDAEEEKKSALNFIAHLQRKKEKETAPSTTEGFTPLFAPKSERSSKRIKLKTVFSTNANKQQNKPELPDTKEEKEDCYETKEEKEDSLLPNQSVSLSHLEDEDAPEDVKTTESINVGTKEDIPSNMGFKKKKNRKQQFRKHTQQLFEGDTT